MKYINRSAHMHACKLSKQKASVRSKWGSGVEFFCGVGNGGRGGDGWDAIPNPGVFLKLHAHSDKPQIIKALPSYA